MIVQTGRALQKRLIAVHANERAMAAPTRGALGRLGYDLVRAQELRNRRPDIRIVDERQLEEVPGDDETPMVLLTGVRALTDADGENDRRIVGRIARPAGLTPLYGLLQQGLETTPRRVPRAATRLPARWIQREKLSIGAILSLSERGCLLRTSDREFASDSNLQVQFALPGAGLLSLAASCVHRNGTDVGLAFSEPPSSMRRAIASFVSELLSAR